MFNYPWGDMHSLNLGWFLLQFKEWVEKIQEYLDNGGGTDENLANVIAPVFNAENSYLTGDYVLYNDELYKALEPVPPGTWNPDAWARCLVTEEMGSSASGVDNVARLMIAGQYSPTYNYQKYAICRYADKLWMCNTNLPAGGEEWEPTHWDEITVGAGLTGLRRSVETLSNDVSDANDAITALQNQFVHLGGTFSNVECAPTATTVIASLSLTPGTWILIGSHDFVGNVEAGYSDGFVDATNNVQLALSQNLSRANGGGITTSIIVTTAANITVNYSTYNAGTDTATARRIHFDAIRIL